MALEKAGISLEAQNFNKYIKQLDTINKTQDEVFNVSSKNLDKGFGSASKSADGLLGSLGNLTGGKGIGGLKQGLSSLGPIATAGFGAVAAGASLAVAGIGAAAVASVNFASEVNEATNQVAASLGISADAAKEYSDEIQNIFVANPAAEFTEIAEAIALTERALDGLTSDELENVANTGLLIEQQFGQDLQKTIGATEQLIEQFGLSSQQATDLLTFGLQNIPAEDLIDTVNEYSNQFAQAGFSANEFFSILQTGVAGGVLGTDRIADATKEFQIRFLEGNKSLVDSFGALGLNFDQLTNDVNSGSKTVSDVFGIVAQRAGEIDLSIASNRAAIAGLGTQFEDLGAAALAGLNTSAIGLDQVAGATDTLNNKFNNVGDAFTQIQRAFLVSIAPLGETLLQSLQPAVSAFTERVLPAFEFAGEALERLIKSLGLANSSSSAFETGLNAVAAVIEGLAGGVEILARATETLRQVFAFARAGAAGFGSIISDVFTTGISNIQTFGSAFKKLISLDFAGAAQVVSEIEFFDINASLDKAGEAATAKFKEIAIGAKENPVEIPIKVGGTEGSGGTDSIQKSFEAQSEAVVVSDKALQSYQNTLKQAQSLQNSFARDAENNALKLARANEDIARKQAKAVSNLEQGQVKERDKLLQNQSKQLDKFEADRRKQIASAEKEVQQERRKAAEQRKRDQEKLNRELQQAQEKFNLSQLQGQRRFDLQEQRLIAEGDVIGLKELREDYALQQQEEQESFAQSQKETKDNAQEQQKEQAQDFESKLNELKSGLENQRAELLASFDQQLIDQQRAQQEARIEQQRAFEEEAAERAIQLQREEEDRRISQQRQLEDLGQSFANQEGVTAEGAAAIASQLETVFGVDGVADSIMTGFATKTENDFTKLFDDLEKIVKDAEEKITPKTRPISIPTVEPLSAGGGGAGSRIGGIPEFQSGGIVPGPIGRPQLVRAHGGETILPTHQSSYQMAAPVIPSQNLTVSGDVNVKGSGFEANEQAVQEAMGEVTESFRIAIARIARRN